MTVFLSLAVALPISYQLAGIDGMVGVFLALVDMFIIYKVTKMTNF